MASSEKPPYFKIDKLLSDVTECISSLSQEFNCSNIPIDDSCTIFHRFCSKLEHFLSLGFKERSNLFGKKRSYWDYMLKSLVSNRGGVHEGLKFVKSNLELKTSVGRGRAFLRFCLVHQCLADTLQQCFSCPLELTMEWYADWAPVRDAISLRLLITALYDLNEVQFDLSSPSCHDLDVSWPVFNRKEFGSPFNWKAISRSGSISSLTSSLSAVDNLNNLRAMGAMGSVQEGSEGGGGGGSGDDVGELNSTSGLEEQPQRNNLREQSEDKEIWWMTEQDLPVPGSSQNVMAATQSWADGSDKRDTEAEEKLKVLQEELARREAEWERRETDWKIKEEEWRSRVEEWEEKERSWRDEKEILEKEKAVQLDEFGRCEEERRVEIDVLKARVLELEVVKVMAECASIGVQATDEVEVESEKQKRVTAEEMLASVVRENEELKIALEQMKATLMKDGGSKCSTGELLTHPVECQKTADSDLKPQANSRNDDDLRREYESQIQNVRELRGMYEDRMKTAEEQNRKLRDILQDKNRRLELSQKRCSELRAHAEELETLLGEQESVARGLQARLSASVEEGRVLGAQLATVNRLFGRLGDTAELDFERLRLLQNSSEGEAAEEVDGDAQGTNGRSDGKEEANDLKEIAVSLPKVWRLLVELLGEEQKEEEAEEANREEESTDGCFDSVPTPYGPRLVISVSRTFIRLKDLILEKKSLQNELGRIRDLNGRLESKLKQQERRLGTVKVELKRTWSLVSKMRAQHRQLHTSEQVLRYELQRKRKLLGELKEELEYCREKWDLARLKNLQSEKEWQILRQEFTARRAADAGLDSTEVNSPESGFSDGRGEDEEEEVDGGIVESDRLATENAPKCSEDSEAEMGVSHDQVAVPLQPLEENQLPPLNEEVHVTSDESNIELINSNSPVNMEEYVVVNSEDASPLNDSNSSTQETSDTPIPVRESIPPDECAPTASTSNSSEAEKLPESEIAPQPGVSAERSMEERLRARAERLRRLEEQCNLLFKKVTRTTTRSTELSNRLEELHEQYGDSRRESPIQADTETGETVLDASACSSVPKSTAIPSETTHPPHPPPTPPPLPNSIPAVRLPSLVEGAITPSVPILSELPTLISNAGASPVVSLDNSESETSANIRQESGQINESLEIAIVNEENRTQSVDPSSVVRLDSPQESQELRQSTPQDVPVNVDELVSSNVIPRNDSVIEEQSSGSEVTEVASPTTQNNPIESLSLMPVVSNPLPVPEETLDISVEQSIEESEAGSGGPTETVHSLVPVIFGGIIEEEDEEGVSGGEEDLGEEEMNLDSSEGIMGEDSVEDNTEEREDMDDEAYIERMSSTIYGLNHGPLFDEGGTSASEDEDREELPEDDDDDEDEMDGDGLSGNAATSGSIGVASLLLQQLPMRMDILRRERLSMEQRLEEGEAALERALASTAAAERRSRMLERGLAQAQERLQVLEMEAAVERNKRLLEIKSSLDAVGDNRSEESESREVQRDVLQTNSPSLQEEIDNLQRQTLAQIAEFKAAAVVSQAQKEQLNTLSEEVERQEHIVNLLEGELKSLRMERKEQAKSLEDASERLSDALELLSLREEEGRAMQLQLEKLRSELESSSEENKKLSCQLAEAEAQVKQLNSEIEQLKDDSMRLQEVVVKLTGEKESLFRANHRLEEMRRLVLEDPKWVSDKESEVCTACGVTFSIMIRRHHCRSCGKIFCGACSSHWLTLNAGPTSQTPSLVAGVVESLMGSGKRSRACAECFAAYSAECADVQPRSPKASCSRGETSNDSKPGSSKCPENPVSNDLEGSEEPELLCSTADDENDGKDDDEEEDVEDFSMISEEEVFLSQCTPYVPNPITLQYWKSCEIQSGVISSASDLLAACLAENGAPGKGREEEVWVRAGAIYSVPILIEVKHIDVVWEFSTNPNSIAFSVLYKPSMDVPMSSALIVVPTTRVNSHLTPTRGRLRPKRAGVYILMFDNSFSRFTGKTISYCLRAEVVCRGAGGRESVTSSSRSSVEPFPDLPIHEEVEEGEGAIGHDESRNETTENDSSTTAEDQGISN